MKVDVRTTLVVFIAGMFLLTASVSVQAAAVDYFLKIDGIDGESTDDRHKNEIDLLSFSWGVSNLGSHAGGGGGGAGKVNMNDFHFNKRLDKATPKLMLACATGQHIPKATLTCRKAGGDQQDYFLVIELTNVYVTSVNVGSGSDAPSSQLLSSSRGNPKGDSVPTETLSLNFEEIKVTYVRLHRSGSLLEEPVEFVSRNEDRDVSRIE